MKTLLIILTAFTISSCSKRDCTGHYMNFENTTYKVMSVMVDYSENMNGRFEHVGSISPAGLKVFKFPQARKYRVAFISTGYREKTHIIEVPACDTTYYHANVQ
jgi:hypothetical protein